MTRKALPALLSLLLSFTAFSGEFTGVFFPDLLPSNTIACIVPADRNSLERDYSGSIFQQIFELPEMGPFLRSFEESRRQFAQDVSATANVPPQLAVDLIESHLGIALINVGVNRDGSPLVEYALSISLRSQPERSTVYAAVMALLNRPEVVRKVLESQGIDPNLPLRTLAQEETVSGYPPILRIGPNIRIAALGNMVLIYNGHGSEGIKKIFDAASNPAQSLSRSPAFQAAYRGSEAGPGDSFTYINTPRLIAILDAMNMGHITRLADSLGLGTVQSIGLAGGFQQDGVRHSLYLNVPGGQATGLMASLVPMPQDSRIGMEGFSQIIPAGAEAFMSMRVDLPVFLQELPYFLDAAAALSRPGGVSGVLANEAVLGVPIPELIRTLGSDMVVQPHDDTLVMMFHNVDIPGFEALVARMEQNAGTRFNSLNVGGYIVRYFNRRSSLSTPLAPAFCLVPRNPGSNRGILYMASHPQAVVSLIQDSTSAREPVSGTQDFRRALGGIGGGNYSLFYYNGNRECYRRVYNFLLPVASVWSSSSRYPVDTGLLPTASSIMPGFFGCAMGVRSLPDGIQAKAYSPLGFNALLVILADKLVVSNPLVIGYAYTAIDRALTAIPTW